MKETISSGSKRTILRTRKGSRSPRALTSELKAFLNYTKEEANLIQKGKMYPNVMGRMKVKTSKIKWTGMDRLMKCYDEINSYLISKIIDKFKEYVRMGHAPGGDGVYKSHPAVARGESDPHSLINSPRKRKGTKPTEWFIEVINKVWLYQEYGFDMKGKKVPGPVADRMLMWAIDKGIVEILVRPPEDTNKARVFKLRGWEFGVHKEDQYRKFGLEELDDTPYMKDLNRLKWIIADIVVRNNSGKDNRRLFLTTAYHNVLLNREFVKDVEIRFLEKWGFRIPLEGESNAEMVAVEVTVADWDY